MKNESTPTPTVLLPTYNTLVIGNVIILKFPCWEGTDRRLGGWFWKEFLFTHQAHSQLGANRWRFRCDCLCNKGVTPLGRDGPSKGFNASCLRWRGKSRVEYLLSTQKLWSSLITSQYLIRLVDVRRCFVEQYVQLFSGVVIYDVQQIIINWRINLCSQQHLLRNQEHISAHTAKFYNIAADVAVPETSLDDWMVSPWRMAINALIPEEQNPGVSCGWNSHTVICTRDPGPSVLLTGVKLCFLLRLVNYIPKFQKNKITLQE